MGRVCSTNCVEVRKASIVCKRLRHSACFPPRLLDHRHMHTCDQSARPLNCECSMIWDGSSLHSGRSAHFNIRVCERQSSFRSNWIELKTRQVREILVSLLLVKGLWFLEYFKRDPFPLNSCGFDRFAVFF